MAPYSYAKSRKMSRYAGWLPARPEVYRSFLHTHCTLGRQKSRAKLAHVPSVAQFAEAIQSDPEMSFLFDQIFLQVAQLPDIKTVQNFNELLYAMDTVVISAPRFYVAKDSHGNPIGEPIGVPLYLLFDLLSNTSAAYDLFRKPAFNSALQALLNSWGQYLTTEPSNSTLNETDEGWFGTIGLASLEEGRGDFNTTYVVPDPSAPNRGYQSWDDFFTREVQITARPVDGASEPSLLSNACESTVYNIAYNVKKHDQFWLKTQAYSLYDMLDRNDEDADYFVGGTVYQAFLSPQDFHRWNSPIDGVIKKAVVVPGTYYAVLPDAGADEDDPDLKPGDPHGALIRSQGWLTLSSARALIIIEADNPDIGLLGFIGVGMAEVSTCEVTVKDGDRVRKGDQLGMFHFGGSSHALILGPNTKVTFADVVKPDTHLWVNSILAQVSKA